MANSSVLRALQGLSGTVQRGFEQRGNLALGEAKLNLEKERQDYGMRMDKLALPGRQAASRRGELELEEQTRLDQPVNVKDLNDMFGMSTKTPEQSLHYGVDIFPKLIKTANLKNVDGIFYRKDGTPFTKRDATRLAPVMHGIVSTLTDPEKQLEDFEANLQRNPDAINDPEVAELLKDPKFQAAREAKNNPNLDQTSYDNWRIQRWNEQISTAKQVYLAVEAGGGNPGSIGKEITRYENKLSGLASKIAKIKEKGKTGLTMSQQINYNQELIKYVDDQTEDYKYNNPEATPEQVKLNENIVAEQYKIDTLPEYKPSKKAMVRVGTDETGKRVYANMDGDLFKDIDGKIPYKGAKKDVEKETKKKQTAKEKRIARFKKTKKAQELYQTRKPLESTEKFARKVGSGFIERMQRPPKKEELSPYAKRMSGLR